MELIIKGLGKKYGTKTAVDEVSLRLTQGVYGLLGANGAGKTTLIRMICGVLRPDRGSIALDHMDVSEENFREVLGYLPQQFGYYPEFTALDFLGYMGTLKGMTKKRTRKEALELLDLVGLKGLEKKKIKTYSGGMKQRLGIAQALLNRPKVLVLDEPTAGLDPKERVRFRNLISQLGKDHIVLLSTHIVSDVENIAGEILIMKGGSVIHQGARQSIIGVIEGKVWECLVDGKKAGELMEKYPVINIRQEGNQVFLRLVCDRQPAEEAKRATANLEDLYLYYFDEEEKDEAVFSNDPV